MVFSHTEYYYTEDNNQRRYTLRRSLRELWGDRRVKLTNNGC
ncbi:hypothetical protein Hanom_Chr12g01150391 [Helianthus anomalus]